MTSQVQIGVVGTSGWSDFMYLSSLRSHPRAKLAALCGQNRQRLEEVAASFEIPAVFTSYQEMIKQADLDALIVGVPDDLHYPVAMCAIDAGLHLICDKPLAITAQQASEMYAAAQSARVKHMVLFTYRWMPFFRFVRNLIDEGYVGRPYHCEFRYLMGYGRSRQYQWRFDQKRANGVLGDLGVHMIDLARWLVGEIDRVSANLSVFVDRPAADGGRIDPANDSAFLLTEFANGAHGVIHASVVAHLADRFMQQQVKLYGEAGSLEVDVPYEGSEAGAVVRVAREHDQLFQTLDVPSSYWGEANRSEPFDVFNHQSVGCRAFVDAIVEDRSVTPTFYDGYKAQQVIEAALEANRSGSWVAIKDLS